MGIPMMVDSDWLAAVDAFVRANAEGVPVPANADDSRFYDVRPVYVRTSWTWDDDEKFWKAKMNFVARDAPTNSVYDVYAPTFSSADAPTVSGRAFAVWRGRWELLDRQTVNYTGGVGINVTGGLIENTGVTSIITQGADSQTLTGNVVLEGEFVSNGLTLGLRDDFIRGGRGITVSPPSGMSASRGWLVTWSGVEVTTLGSATAASLVREVAIAEGANARAAGDTLELTAPPTRTLRIVTGVAINPNNGSLIVQHETVEVVVPQQS